MSTLELKSDLHTLIDSVNDSQFLKAIQTLLKKQVSVSDEIVGYQNGKAISKKEFLKRIDTAETEYKQGKYVTIEELQKEIW